MSSNTLQHGVPRQVAASSNKVPPVTADFWIVKVLATTVGETAADFLSTTLGLGLTGTSCVMAAVLAVALLAQFRSRRYVPGVYWITVVLISVVGTLATDNLTDNLGVPLAAATVGFALALLVTFTAWQVSEKTLSIHTINTARREGFYWSAILFTFALGTAAGDLTAERLNLGYALSVLLFGGLIVVVALAHRGFGLGAIPAFWIAYILTRPLGASLGDLLSQTRDDGGLGMGTTWTSALFLTAITALVGGLRRARVTA
jgi:uncharacterized membrane-anchored protein